MWYPEFFQAVFIGINSFTALSQPFEVYMVIILMLQGKGERHEMADNELCSLLKPRLSSLGPTPAPSVCPRLPAYKIPLTWGLLSAA